jgi:galactose oxidase-like protein
MSGSMNSARIQHTASLLNNSKVLVTGGCNSSILNSAELYDPATGIWTVTESMKDRRSFHTASVLPNGKVLVAGGIYGMYALRRIALHRKLFLPTEGTPKVRVRTK